MKESPLYWALYCNHKEIFKYLIENNAEINQKGDRGNSIVMEIMKFKNKDLFEYIIDRNPDFTIKNDEGENGFDLL